MKNPFHAEPVLVAGATGYVGSRLVPRLLDAGYRVRVMGRSLSKLSHRPWATHHNIEVQRADVLDLESLANAADGCWAAFYLVHSMNQQQKDFAEADRKAAQNMTEAAAWAGLERIIYLGGLGVDNPTLSKHLRSRAEVARIFQAGPVPATVLRAAVILGSGSVSFEIIRYLVDRLPVITTPRWVRTPCQPIAIRNVLYYLQGCLEHEETIGKTYDIGGPEILTYQRLMEIYAEEAGLPKRKIVPVSLLTPRMSSYWIHLVTPVPSFIARPLVEGLRNPVVCEDDRIRSIIPQKLLGCREAIQLALERTIQHRVETSWSDAGIVTRPEWVQAGDAPYAGGTVLECGYRVLLQGPRPEIWESIKSIGGERGWYFADPLWRLRGILDRLIGGIGLRGGRRHPAYIYPGDALDFWRVLEIHEPKHLHLVAEMKLPGQATLEFDLLSLDESRTELRQLAKFLPKGLFGILYWYALRPVHRWLFKGMLEGIAHTTGKPILRGPKAMPPGLKGE